MKIQNLKVTETKLFLFLAALFLVYPLKGKALEYNFNFYNGDVSTARQATNATEVTSPAAIVVPAQLPAPVVQPANTQIEKETSQDESEKLKRSGLSFITGYSQNEIEHSRSFLNGLEAKTFRVGLSFISSYDFSLDVEFLSNELRTNVDLYGDQYSLSGHIPGISIGVKNNYWLSENLGVSLGAGIKGMRGTLANRDYHYESFGAALSAGPTLQFGKVQVSLAYEYGVDNVSLESRDNLAFSENNWTQGSTIKGILGFRF